MRQWLAVSALLSLVAGNVVGAGRHPKQTFSSGERRLLRNLVTLLKNDPDLAHDVSADDGDSQEEMAEKWMMKTNKELIEWNRAGSLANWEFVTNFTDETRQKMLSVESNRSRWYQSALSEGKQFETNHFRPDLRRQIEMFVFNSESDDPAVEDEIRAIQSEMETIYSTAKVCFPEDKGGAARKGKNKCLSLEPDLVSIMAQSRNPILLLIYWANWRDVSGRPIRRLYERFVELLNVGAKQNGFADFGAAWRKELFFDSDNLNDMTSHLWSQLRPLYLHLHAYVRRRLREHYGVKFVGEDGTIPAHLLGNMWAQNWENIYSLVVPYPEVDRDFSSADRIIQRKYDVMGLFRLAEDFFVSIDLFNMTKIFWEKSMLVKPPNRDVQCHASAEDMFAPGDFRIKMCTEVSESYLETIHHEMGHVEYFMAYSHLPPLYRDGANCAFHEAIGDTIALSVMSRTHQRVLGLDTTQPGADDYKRSINDLMKMALYKIGFLPFGLLVDRWRWNVFSNVTKLDNLNRDWWQLRLDLQGVRSPIPRSEDDFDPGSKFHIPSNSPYICYFVSTVVQFQFYKAMCEASGHEGSLHECDFYRSPPAGRLLKRLLELGASRPWQEALQKMTGSREISASALLEYFRPLEKWLKFNNDLYNEKLGWKGAKINWKSE
ncbi:angiotensin-converting enzyme-like isoform X2 [Pomacea canaliculata]|nr:angiotensin-converting enzyme-like isoform X2 [Pomacea canaliculata]XP_025082746.1 angiotensin-converting enzyme-like isoform X2 [Pomacea canaliculata]